MSTVTSPEQIRLDPDQEISARIWTGDTDQNVLLVHGMGDCSWIWRPVIAAWPGPRPTFIAVDLPGHGDSKASSRRDMKCARVAERLAQALAPFAPDPHWIVGHSAGAKVALGLIQRGGVQARGLSIIDSADEHSPPIRDRLYAHIAGLRRGAPNIAGIVAGVTAADPFADAELLDAYFRAAAVHDGALWQVPVGRGAEALLSTDIDMVGALAQLDCPVQVIRGAMSSICTSDMVDRFVAACTMPAQAVTIDQAGHAISMEQPAALAAALAGAILAAQAEPLRRSG